MIRIMMKSTILSSIILTLLVCNICISFAPSTQAAVAPVIPQEGLTALNNIIGLYTEKYAVNVTSIKPDLPNVNLGSKNIKDITYQFTSDTSKIKILCTFVDDKLNIIHVIENTGTPLLTKAAPTGSILQMAKAILNNYQTYNDNSAYADLQNSLDKIILTKNSTTIIGNTQVDVSSVAGEVNLKWTYQYDGIIAPAKFITLSFKDNFFEAFVDNWNLYPIGNTQVGVSKNQAITTALQTAKTYFQSLKDADNSFSTDFTQSNIHFATMIFDNSVGANTSHVGEKTTLYPVYRFGVGLDKTYGSLYGLEVDIWADTGEVRWMQEAWLVNPENTTVTDTNTSTSSLSAGSILLPTFIAGVVIVTCLLISQRKHQTQYGVLKKFSKKNMLAIASIFVIAFTLISCVPAASAAKAYVWGSESDGAYGYGAPPNDSWRKHSTEVFYQQVECAQIANYFTAGGYASYNHQGTLGSYKSNILSDLYAIEHDNDQGVVVDFDHGNGCTDYNLAPGEFHYLFEDNRGTYTGPWSGLHTPEPNNGVYDIDVYNNISYGKVKFALINTCRSADIVLEGPPGGGMGYYGAVGMPYAWTHRVVKSQGGNFNVINDISVDGYGDPDSGNQCYLGFSWGSASLMERIPYPNGVHTWAEWIEYFFYNALWHDMSVHSALDQASLSMYGYTFGAYQNPLWRYGAGFTAYWWNPWGSGETASGCHLEVYGNANIHLRLLPEPTQWWLNVAAQETTYGTGLNPQVTVDGVPVGTAPVWDLVSVGQHTVGVDNWAWSSDWSRDCYFSYFSTWPGGGPASNPGQINVSQDTYTTAYYDMS